jgi:hypothetical protein
VTVRFDMDTGPDAPSHDHPSGRNREQSTALPEIADAIRVSSLIAASSAKACSR